MPKPATMIQICCFENESVVTFEAQRPNPTAAMAQPMTTARLAPSRSSIRPPICAAMTKPMKKYNKKMPAPEAESRNAISAYSLAKKNTGMKVIMAINKTRFSMANGRMRKILTLISGDSVRASTATKTPMMISPAKMQIHVHGLLHPHGTACCRPKTLRPMPAAMSTAPR